MCCTIFTQLLHTCSICKKGIHVNDGFKTIQQPWNVRDFEVHVHIVKPHYLKLKGTEIKLISQKFEILVQCIGVKYKTYTEVTVWILWLTGPRNHPARAVHVPHHNQCPPGGVSVYYSESTGHITGYSFQEGNTCTA